MNDLMNKFLVFISAIRRIAMIGAGMLILNLQAMAQEEGVDGEIDVNINDGGGGAAWYYNWWIWIGLAIFIIVIVAIVSAGRRR